MWHFPNDDHNVKKKKKKFPLSEHGKPGDPVIYGTLLAQVEQKATVLITKARNLGNLYLIPLRRNDSVPYRFSHFHLFPFFIEMSVKILKNNKYILGIWDVRLR